MRFSLARLAKEFSGDRTTTIKVAKAYCVPSRYYLTGILNPYHVWFDAPAQDKWAPLDPATGMPQYQTATIVVKAKQAAWAEYLILSAKPHGTPIFQVLGRLHNPKNAQWAARRQGLPTPWQLESGNLKGAWKESGCKMPDTGDKRLNTATTNVVLSQIGGINYTSERQPRPQRPARRTRTRTTRRKRR